MSDKMKNLIVRSITGVFFVAAIVVCFMRPIAMEFLFALVTGLTIWEYCGLVNNIKGVQVNRFISTVAGVYFFLAVGGFCSGMIQSGAVFIPYLLTIVYLFISELYMKTENAINDWAHTISDRCISPCPSQQSTCSRLMPLPTATLPTTT